VKDLILLKSGDSVTIKIPVILSVKISKDCAWQLKDYEHNNGLNVSIIYKKKKIEFESKYLNKKTLKTLKRMRYILYTDEIISNNVILISKHVDNLKDIIQKNIIKNDSLKYLDRLRKHVDIPKGSIQEKYFRYLTQNLSHPNRDKRYPFFPIEQLCSIEKCFRYMSYTYINEIIYHRLIEIARVNFKNKVYLYLVAGTGSVEFAEKQNENITDNNHFIYISVDDFIDSKDILKGVEIYNTETRKLMEKIKRQ